MISCCLPSLPCNLFEQKRTWGSRNVEKYGLANKWGKKGREKEKQKDIKDTHMPVRLVVNDRGL